MAVSRPALEQAVRQRLGSSHFELMDFAEEAAGDQLGFMSANTRLRARVRHCGMVQDLHFFTKRALPQPSKSMQDFHFQSFHKEVEFYNKLLNPLLDVSKKVTPLSPQSNGPRKRPCLETSADWVEEPVPSFAPRWYLATDEVLIIQDLKHEGFMPIDDKWMYDGLSAHTAKVVLRALAALHASSLLLSCGPGPSPAQRAPLLLQEGLFTSDREAHGHRLLETTARAEAQELLKRILPDRMPAVLTRHFEGLVLGSVRQLDAELVRRCASTHADVMVVCHGDPWPNNVMLRLDEDGKAQQAVLVDFQFSRWAPPALDVLMFLYISCRRALRNRELAALLQGYHAELKRCTSAGGLDLSKVLPIDAFLRSASRLLPVARAIACSYLPVCAAPPASIARVLSDPLSQQLFMSGESRGQVLAEWFDSSKEYRERVTEALRELMCLD